MPPDSPQRHTPRRNADNLHANRIVVCGREDDIPPLLADNLKCAPIFNLDARPFAEFHNGPSLDFQTPPKRNVDGIADKVRLLRRPDFIQLDSSLLDLDLRIIEHHQLVGLRPSSGNPVPPICQQGRIPWRRYTAFHIPDRKRSTYQPTGIVRARIVAHHSRLCARGKNVRSREGRERDTVRPFGIACRHAVVIHDKEIRRVCRSRRDGLDFMIVGSGNAGPLRDDIGYAMPPLHIRVGIDESQRRRRTICPL